MNYMIRGYNDDGSECYRDLCDCGNPVQSGELCEYCEEDLRAEEKFEIENDK